MNLKTNSSILAQRFRQILAQGGILIFFIMAFEVMVMISPFAFFFYSVFNPLFHWLQDYSATRWLTVFFLPHMILPPTLFLKAVRVLGSILFVFGSLTFLVCASQVYLGKVFKWGIVTKGLYRFIRHPQYVALGLWGTGMSILWPRFLVLASLSLMFILYFFLARDEERRMLNSFGESYRGYLEHTGMFMPASVEAVISAPFEFLQNRALRILAVLICIPALVIGSGFILREITLRSLALEARQNVTLVSMLPEDDRLARSALKGFFEQPGQLEALGLRPEKDYLAYLMPPDYVMQGMIADTGTTSHLHQQHQTFVLIADWIFNPFEHLRRSPSAQMAEVHGVDLEMARRHHCPLGVDVPNLQCSSCPYRRIIFLQIDHRGTEHRSKAELFSFDVARVPVCFIDLNTDTGKVVDVRQVGKFTAWKDVPTPAI